MPHPSVSSGFRLAVAAVVFAAAAYGQTPAPARFEVVSVRPGGDVFSTRPERSGGRIRWTTQLCYLIGYAERLDFSRVSGAKCGAVYAVEATFDPAASEGQVRAMFRSLLAERFKLRGRRVTAEVDGHALVTGRGGAKLKQAAGPPGYVSAVLVGKGVISITGRGATLSQLADTLGRSLGTPVWDRTGVTGVFDFAFRFKEDAAAAPDADAPSLATALQESLGLRLQKQKGPLERFVIDSVEEPSGN